MDDPATSACRRGFLAWTFIASIHPSNPCSTISRELIPQHRGGLAIDMLALSISAMSHKRMVPRPSTMARKPCEDEVVSQLLELGGRGTAGDLSKRALERLPSVNGAVSA
jgi:hypothetical protein